MKPEESTFVLIGMQVALLKGMIAKVRDKLIHLKVDASTIDAVQGQERDVILLSLVRSKEPGAKTNLDFVNDRRRINVALTRARTALWVFGNVETLTDTNSEFQRVSVASGVVCAYVSLHYCMCRQQWDKHRHLATVPDVCGFCVPHFDQGDPRRRDPGRRDFGRRN